MTLDTDGRNLRLKPDGSFDFTPGSANNPASKAYVDALIEGVRYKDPVHAATTGALPANTYDNGTAGEGATLTGNANGAFPSIDGVAPSLNQRYLVKDEAAPENNGIYDLTQVGDGSNPYILTRSVDADTADEIGGMVVVVDNDGAVNGESRFFYAEIDVIVGTTAINFVDWGGGTTYTGGNGIDVTGTTIAVDLATNSGLEFNTNQLRVNADTGLVLSASGVAVDLNANGGLEFIGNEVRVHLPAASGLQTNATGLSLDLLSTGGLALTGNELGVLLPAGSGLQVDGTGLQVFLDGGTLSKSAAGLKVANLGIDSGQIATGAVLPNKLSFVARSDVIDGTTFIPAAGIRYEVNLSNAAQGANEIIDEQAVFVNGLRLSTSGNPMVRVAGVPAADGEWRIAGNLLQVALAIPPGGGDWVHADYHS